MDKRQKQSSYFKASETFAKQTSWLDPDQMDQAKIRRI